MKTTETSFSTASKTKRKISDFAPIKTPNFPLRGRCPLLNPHLLFYSPSVRELRCAPVPWMRKVGKRIIGSDALPEKPAPRFSPRYNSPEYSGSDSSAYLPTFAKLRWAKPSHNAFSWVFQVRRVRRSPGLSGRRRSLRGQKENKHVDNESTVDY